jgi:WD40 repeat protein
LVALEGESLMSTLESNVASDDLASTSVSGRRVPFVTLDQRAENISIIELSTRHLVRVGVGRMPAFDSNELLAYCDAAKTVQVVRIPREGSIVPVTEVSLPFEPSTCPELAWSRDGQLAILAPQRGGSPRLMLFSIESGLRHIDLPPSTGASPLTWSSDDSMLAFSSGHDTYVIEASDGHIAATLEGLSRPVFSPTEARLVAGFDERRGSIVVRSVVGDDVAEASDVSSRSSIAWSPDGTRIAVAANAGIGEWNIASNEVRELYRPDGASIILPAVLWIS